MTNILWCHCTFCETDKLVAYAKHSCFAPVQQWCQGVGIRYAVEAAERRVHARIPKLLRISRVEADTDAWNSLLHEMNKYLFFDEFFFFILFWMDKFRFSANVRFLPALCAKMLRTKCPRFDWCRFACTKYIHLSARGICCRSTAQYL